MNIQDCLPLMSRLYLSRTVDSIYKESLPKGDEESLREQVLQNKGKLINAERILQSLEMQDIPRSYRLLYESILTTLLEAPDMACKDDDLFNNIREYENKIIKEFKSKDALSATDIYEICKKLKGIKTSGSKND